MHFQTKSAWVQQRHPVGGKQTHGQVNCANPVRQRARERERENESERERERNSSFLLMSQGMRALKKKKEEEEEKKAKQNNDTVSLEASSFTFVWLCVYSECVRCNTSPLRPARVSIDQRDGLHSSLNCKQVTSKKATADPTASFTHFKGRAKKHSSPQ